MENDLTTSELMKFYTVRNPEPVSTAALSAYISYPASVETPSDYLTALSSILSQKGEPAKVKLEKVKQQVEHFISSPQFISTEEKWQSLLPKLKDFKNDILQLKKEEITSDLIRSRIANYFSDAGFDPEINRQAWDNLITYNLIGGKENLIRFVSDIIRAKNLISYALSDKSVYNERIYQFRSQVLLPKSIFPLPQSNEDGKESQQPATETEVQLKQFEEAKNTAKTIELFNNALDDIKITEEHHYEQIRNKTAELPPVTVDDSGNPKFPEPSGETRKTGVMTGELMEKLNASTRELLAEQNIKSDATISFVINALEKKKEALAISVSKKLNLTQTAYVTGDSILLHSPIVDSIQSSADSIFGPIIKPGTPILIDNGQIEISGPVFSIDEPDTPFSDAAGCKVKPLGIADLRRLEQKLICNVPGEIAHIENILKSEVKERETRRLRKTEETETTSSDKEVQEQRDTITTERFQMDQAVNKVLEKKQAVDVGVTVDTSYKNTAIGLEVKVGTKAGYTASSTSTTTDTEAIKYAKDVTDTAKKLIIEKTHNEQIRKVVDEFEETNKHLFDNRDGQGHVVGIYRWIDKIYEAQVVNYGKRLMFEFMVPDPAAFHRYAMAGGKIADALSIVKPLDPVRDITAISGVFPGITPLKSAADITESNYIWWAGLYNAKVDGPPQFEINIGMSKAATGFPNDGTKMGNLASDDLVVPEGYEAHEVSCNSVYGHSSVAGTQWIYWNLGKAGTHVTNWGTTGPFAMNKEQGKVPFTITGRVESFTITVNLKCRRTESLLTEWKLNTYNTIRSAYEALLSEYNLALAEAKSKMNEGILGKNPMLNRAIEQTELRKHAVRMLSHCTFNASKAMKTDYPGDGVPYPDFNCCEAISDGKLVQFIEDCFEFGLMSYNFYPYFWSRKDQWKTIYRLEDADPIFTQFLQAGYARVQVPVRPGFEEAALRYVSDGTIWNGEDVPGIDDQYYVSLIEEVKKPVGTVEGEPWQIRIPTSLTILQNEANGIDESGLPCNPEGLG